MAERAPHHTTPDALHQQPIRVRPSGLRVVATGLAALFIAFGVAFVVEVLGSSPAPPAVPVLAAFAIWTLLCVLVWYRMCRAELRLDASGVSVDNFWTHQHFAWSQIVAASFLQLRTKNPNRPAAELSFVVTGGDDVPVRVVRSSASACGWKDVAVERRPLIEALERRGVPVSTGQEALDAAVAAAERARTQRPS